MKKTTTLTVALTLVFVIAAVFLLVFSFQRLKTSDVAYAQVENPNEGKEAQEEKYFTQEDAENYKKVHSYVALEEFEVDGNTYYYYTTEYKPEPQYIRAKEAAQIASDAFEETYPDRDWSGELIIKLMSSRGIGFFSENETKDMVSLVYCVFYPESKYDGMDNSLKIGSSILKPLAIINPVTGKVVSLSCPNQDWLYNYGYNTPWISLHDFINFTNEQTWIRIGSKYIRESGLNGDEIVVRYDESREITFGLNGTVHVDFLIGSGQDASRIHLTIDMYTKECGLRHL